MDKLNNELVQSLQQLLRYVERTLKWTNSQPADVSEYVHAVQALRAAGVEHKSSQMVAPMRWSLYSSKPGVKAVRAQLDVALQTAIAMDDLSAAWRYMLVEMRKFEDFGASDTAVQEDVLSQLEQAFTFKETIVPLEEAATLLSSEQLAEQSRILEAGEQQPVSTPSP